MRDPKKEQTLNELGFAWEFVQDYPINKIDWKEADENHARLGVKLDLDVAVGYAEAMEAGADWTAITVKHTGEPLDQLIDGRHSTAAMKLAKPERKTVDAYVIRDHDPYRIDMLIRISNVNNGRESSVSERLLHIAEMRRIWPHTTLKELSQRFHVKQKVITEYIKVLDSEKRAEGLGVGHIIRGSRHQFSMDIKRALNTLQNDVVFVRAVQLLAKHPLELRGQAGNDFVTSLRDAGSERRAMQLMEARDQEISRSEEERKLRKSVTPRTYIDRFMSEVRRVQKRFPGSVEKLYMEGYTCPQLRRERKLVDQVIDILMDTRVKMDTLIEEQERTEAWQSERLGKLTSDATSPTL